ncbi:hypothetical protein AO073_27160 [Pseudomonas syringae ICMP 11293]|uniref:hypothetical protein n=1 Tax=Pseudomonas syringae TaxID=317 RepID=UPI00072FD06E|nr:hypothetical protein [Pseudomonas syringae]KTB90228.1 hypothetical protein AO073_27160 [Pseudomonas syringae ICMP 11293]
MKKLVFWGAFLTVAYLALMGWWLSVNWAAFLCLKLNELGDFLAGTFGPVAFLWLVLGFIQQGRELRLQSEELMNSVQQQTEMNRLQAAGLANHDRLLQPIFEIKYIENYHWQGDFFERFQIENSGGYCDCLTIITVVDGVDRYPLELEPLNTGTKRIFSLDSDFTSAELRVSYRALNDFRGVRIFDVKQWHWDEGDAVFTIKQRQQ